MKKAKVWGSKGCGGRGAGVGGVVGNGGTVCGGVCVKSVSGGGRGSQVVGQWCRCGQCGQKQMWVWARGGVCGWGKGNRSVGNVCVACVCVCVCGSAAVRVCVACGECQVCGCRGAQCTGGQAKEERAGGRNRQVSAAGSRGRQ